jgi:hypothetical protein
MRGDIIFRVYGVHVGRAQDSFFGAFRTRDDAVAKIATLNATEMHGSNWAAQYHNQGFVVREHVVEIDFEIPPRPKPRDKYVARASPETSDGTTWVHTNVEVHQRHAAGASELLCKYERNYSMLRTFEPFRQGKREMALISRDYTATAVLDLASGVVIAEELESSPGSGFCPVGFYVPDWWDLNDGSIVPGSEYWNADREWPSGEFGFVWGCYWGDDSSWKVQYLDLRRVQEGIITRDERFGYIELASATYAEQVIVETDEAIPSLSEDASRPPRFIHVSRSGGNTNVRFAVDL